MRKDLKLFDLASEKENVAQFASFRTPGYDTGVQRTARAIAGKPLTSGDSSSSHPIHDAAADLLQQTGVDSVNVRTFDPDDPKSKPFHFGLETPEEAARVAWQELHNGLHVIVHENIDIYDGGVSGVAVGDLVEFVPDDTVRGVEKAGACAMPRALAYDILRTVYGVDLPFDRTPTTDERLEWSVHPEPQGYYQNHQIVWEKHEVDNPPEKAPMPRWPNKFSEMIGGKTFGLLVADALGVEVPRTQAVMRRIAPFQFGTEQPTAATWTRAAGASHGSGKYTTARGAADIFQLTAEEDPTGEEIAGWLYQDEVEAAFAGSARTRADGSVIVEGTAGFGDGFMAGDEPDPLPRPVEVRVRELTLALYEQLGPVSIEWAVTEDSRSPKLLQLHREATAAEGSAAKTVVPGSPEEYVDFDPDEGLEALRKTIAEITGHVGIRLTRPVGLTSHFGDVLRHNDIPAVIDT